MLKVGDIITVRYSKKLAQNHGNLLTNRDGVVTHVLRSGGKIIGVYADIKVMRRTRNYYIPICSVDGSNEVNQIRALSMLKSTVL